jgi:hypothetical protein
VNPRFNSGGFSRSSWLTSLARNLAMHSIGVACLVLLSLLPTGCRTEPARYETSPPAAEHGKPLRVGDKVVVSSPAGSLFPPRELTIGEDGTLEVPVAGKVVAAGKTLKELEMEIQGLLNANRDRYFFVEGEVNRPGPKLFVGPTDLVHAIEFDGVRMAWRAAKHRTTGVVVIHPNGKTVHVDYRRVLRGENDGFPIYPGDRIVVSTFGN